VANHWSGHSIAAFEDSAIDSTVAKGDDDLRIRRLFVDILQCALHVYGDWSCDSQCIRMPRRRDNMDAKPFHVLDSIRQRIHLHLAGIARARIHFADGERTPEGFGLSDCLEINLSLEASAFGCCPVTTPVLRLFLSIRYIGFYG